MKKLLFSLAFVAFAAMTIVSCGSKSDPKSVATSFLTARNKMDYENAKKFGTPETGKMLDMLASFSSMVPDSVKNLTKDAKIEIKGEPKIEGEKCTLTATTTMKGQEPKDETITLVMKDKKWLVNMSKDDMGAGAEAPADASTAVPADEAMPMDSAAHK